MNIKDLKKGDIVVCRGNTEETGWISKKGKKYTIDRLYLNDSVPYVSFDDNTGIGINSLSAYFTVIKNGKEEKLVI